jgi:hypothetical protein
MSAHTNAIFAQANNIKMDRLKWKSRRLITVKSTTGQMAATGANVFVFFVAFVFLFFTLLNVN